MASRPRAARGRGDELREEILAATRELLTKVGSANEVSIRAISKAVGVTAPSIYRHFADKDDLIEAVCLQVFDRLDEEMQSAIPATSSPAERLRLQGLTYVRFALENPEEYRLATMVHSSAPGMLDSALTSNAFVHLMETIQACIDDGTYPETDPVNAALLLWSSAHGIASLMLTKPFLPWGEREETAERALRNASIGASVVGLFDSPPTPDEFKAWLDQQPRP